MLYRTNWSFFYFFQLLGMSTPRCPAFRSWGGLCTVESWFGWKFALHAIWVSLLSRGSWWAFHGLLPSPAVEFCFPLSPPSSVGFPPVPSANSLVAFLPADKASVPGEETETRPWWLHFPSPSAQWGRVFTTLVDFPVSVWWGFWGKSYQSVKPTRCLWFTGPSHSQASPLSAGKDLIIVSNNAGCYYIY